MRTFSTTVDVYIDDVLENLDDDELLEEVKERGLSFQEGVDNTTVHDLLTKIWNNRRLGKDYEKELDDLIYEALGKLV